MLELILSAGIVVIDLPPEAPKCEQPPAFVLQTASGDRFPVIRAEYAPDGLAISVVRVIPGRVHCSGFE